MELSNRNTLSQDRLPLFVLFGANTISLTGSVLTLIAVPWFVLRSPFLDTYPVTIE